jgi:hypothetical protein
MKAIMITCVLLIAAAGYAQEYTVPYDLSKFGIPVTIKTSGCRKVSYLSANYRDSKEDFDLMITQNEAIGQWRLKKQISMDMKDDSEELKIIVKEPDGYIGVNDGVYGINYYKELNGYTFKLAVTTVTTKEDAPAIYGALKGKSSARYNQSLDLSKLGMPLVINASSSWKLNDIEIGIVIDIDQNKVYIKQHKTDKYWEAGKLMADDLKDLGKEATLLEKYADGFITYTERDTDEFYDIYYYKQVNGNTIRFNVPTYSLVNKEKAKAIYNAIKGK